MKLSYIAEARTEMTKAVRATRAATDNRGWRIHRGFCDVCDEGLQARRPSKTGRRTHATKRHVCATHRRRAHLKKGSRVGQAPPLLHGILRVSSVTPRKQGEYFVSHAS